MHWPTQPILLTGPTGWLGSRLVEAFRHGLRDDGPFGQPPPELRLRCLALSEPDAAAVRALAPQIEVVVGDLRRPADCQRFCAEAGGGTLFHTAGVIHPRRVADFYAVNVAGTRHLLEAAIRAGVRRVVAVSSNSPCGCNPHPDHLFDELSPYRPYLHYGRSKMLMERAVQACADRIETVLVRAPWFYGPNQPARQTLFFRLIRQGRVPIVGRGDNLRSLAYVDNLCQGLLLAGSVGRAAGQLYWIADARPYSMNEIVDTVERLLEREFGRRCAHRRIRLPRLVGAVAYALDGMLQALGLYHQKLHVLSEMHRTIACSVARARRELGYAPRIELEEGMRRSLQWCLERGATL